MAKVSVKAQLSEASVAVGDVVTLEIRAIADAREDIEVEFPTVDGLSIIGQSESTQMSMSWTSSGQKLRREKILRLELSADSPGIKKIPPIKAKVRGEQGQSKPLKLSVRDLQNALAPQAATGGAIILPDPSENNIFIRYRLSQGEVWLGQQVFLDLEIFADPRLNFRVETLPEPPDLDGFWREMLERPKRLSARREVVDGEVYQVFRAWRFALFPLQAGERTLPPIIADFRTGGGGLFATGSRARRRTRALTLNVKPLPTKGRRSKFSPSNIGVLDLNATLDKTEVKTGKAVVLKLTLSGTGNIKSLRLPELTELDGFRVFPPTLTDEIKQSPKSGVSGQKVAEILLVPNQPGRHRIPSLKLPVFDPNRGEYVRLKTKPLSLKVVGEAPTEIAKAPTTQTPQTEAPTGPERRPLRFEARLQPAIVLPWNNIWWWALVISGPLLVVLRWIAVRVLTQLNTQTDAQKETTHARTAAQEQRKKAQDAAQQGDAATAASACIEAFYAQAKAQLQIQLRGQTSEEVAQTLLTQGASEAYARKVAKALDGASYTRYAPSGAPDDVHRLVQEWTQLIEQLNQMKKVRS